MTGGIRTTLIILYWATVLLSAPRPVRADSFPADSISASALPNGLRVVVKYNPGSPLTAISIWIKAGSHNETDANNGVAHLLEHYLFEKTGDPDHYTREIERLGGQINAETARDDTHYYVVLPTTAWERGLSLLSAMVTRATLDATQMELERHRATDEVETRNADPVQAARDALFQLADGAYLMPAAGTTSSLQKLTLTQIKSFYQLFYHPENASLVVVGDVPRGTVLAAAHREFDAWSTAASGPTPAVPPSKRSATSAFRLIPTAPGAPQALVAVAFPAPSVQFPHDSVAMDLIYTLIAGGRHSMVARRIPELADAGSDYLTQRYPGLFIVWGTVQSDRVSAVAHALEETMGAVAGGNFTDQELQSARTQLLGGFALESESTLDQCTTLGFYEGISTFQYALEYEDRIRGTARDDLIRVARACITSSFVVAMAPPGTTVAPSVSAH